MDIPSMSKFQGEFHVISEHCVIGHRPNDPDEEWYIWFTPKRGESKTFVVDLVAEGVYIGDTIEINGSARRVDDIDIRKRNKKGKITLVSN
jgi:hypothetical protein